MRLWGVWMEPERKKSKAEVMKEVMAKSKLHKYERQQAKEDDEELREELDKDLNRGGRSPLVDRRERNSKAIAREPRDQRPVRGSAAESVAAGAPKP